ncbi:unnamed protein product, partial [Musa textilis]
IASLQLELVICLLCKPITLELSVALLMLLRPWLDLFDQPIMEVHYHHLPNNGTSHQSLSTSLFSFIKFPHFLHNVRCKKVFLDVISLYYF